MSEQASMVSVCPECGAELNSAGDACWLCHGTQNPYAAPAAAIEPTAPSFSAGTVLDNLVAGCLVGVVVLVGIGIAVDEPRGLIGYAIVMLPGVLGATAARRRQQRQARTGFWGSKTVAVLFGAFSIVVATVLLTAALVALLFAICAASGASFH